MPSYLHPGVYIEHVPSGLLSIEAASTSVAAFIGPVKRGPIGEPVFITNSGQFAQQFGVLNDGAGGIRDEGDFADKFGYEVNAFFANGGTKAYIVRVAEDAESASTVIPNPADAAEAFEVTAKSEGVWADDLVVHLSTVDEAAPADLTLGYRLDVGSYEDGEFVAVESFDDLQMESDAAKSIVKVVNDNSTLITLEMKDVGGAPPEIPPEDLKASAFKSGDIVTTDPLELVTDATPPVPKTLGIKIGDEAPVTVSFTKNTSDLKAVAKIIQDTVSRHKVDDVAIAPDFIARVIIEGSAKKLLLISGILGAPGKVTVPSGTAASVLKLSGAGSVDYPPVTLVDGSEMIEAFLTGGKDGKDAPGKAFYNAVYLTLRDYRDVSIILLPGLEWIEGGDNAIIEGAVTHSEFMKNRMVIIDPPDPVGGSKLVTPKDVKDLGAPTSPYTALYYPWMEVSNPHYDPDTAANKPKKFRIPPSGFGAGMWARIDARRGVWKAPAGLEATVRGSIGPNILIGNDLQDNLNNLGINCMRAIVGPTVIWGARTLATKTKPEFRYVPVRRTQNMIGESLFRALQAVVFEPNDHRLWGNLRASVGTFMDGLYRSGAFQGEKASDAYYVQCGLGATMTQGDIDAGVVRVVVGFAPLKPAEFVIVQIKQIVGQTA